MSGNVLTIGHFLETIKSKIKRIMGWVIKIEDKHKYTGLVSFAYCSCSSLALSVSMSLLSSFASSAISSLSIFYPICFPVGKFYFFNVFYAYLAFFSSNLGSSFSKKRFDRLKESFPYFHGPHNFSRQPRSTQWHLNHNDKEATESLRVHTSWLCCQ